VHEANAGRKSMGITFPRESAAYRADRDRLLAHEIELRRAMEAVAVERRALSPGGIIPEDYVFQRGGVDGAPVDVRLSELFAPGRDSLVVYSAMYPRAKDDERSTATTSARQTDPGGDR
jgi:predicted dithiol-disulfide oxidoreductase (DUF899 family)